MLTENQISALRASFPAEALSADNSRGFRAYIYQGCLCSRAPERSVWTLWLWLALRAFAFRVDRG